MYITHLRLPSYLRTFVPSYLRTFAIICIILQHHLVHGSCSEVSLAGATVTPLTTQFNFVQLPPQFTNVTVVNNTHAGTLCTPSLQVTDSTVTYDMATPGKYNNFHDYDVLKANRSTFSTYGSSLLITATDAAAFNAFGNAVALSGDGSTLAVGSTLSSVLDGGTFGFGADTVYLYRRIQNNWVFVQAIQSPFISASLLSGFGTSVVLSYDGSILAIGAPGSSAPNPVVTNDNSYSVGAVYIYIYSSSNNLWNLLQTIPGLLGFGMVVDLSATGQYLAIGSNNTINTTDTPSVFVYERQNICTNTQEPYVLQTQLIPTVNGTPFVGSSSQGASIFKHMALSSDGTTIAWGCLFSLSSLSTVFLFQRLGSQWQQVQAIPSPAGGTQQFGISVALSANGKYLAVGVLTPPTILYIYARRGTTWQLETSFSSGTTFRATSLSFSADGTILVAGNYLQNATLGTCSIFLRGPNKHWSNVATFSGATSGDDLGFSCACSADGSVIATGAPQVTLASTGYAILLRSIGTTIPNDTVVSGSLCVYHRTTVDSSLKVAGNIHLQGTLVTGTTGHVTTCTVPTSSPSDKRIKNDIAHLDSRKVLEIIRSLQPIHFTWNKPDPFDTPHGSINRAFGTQGERAYNAGFVAQELEQLLPHCVKTQMAADGHEIKMIYLHHEFYAYLIGALQEIAQRVQGNKLHLCHLTT
jgi:hypothetical protein